MWRKSSFCNGASACVEIHFRKAEASNTNGECLEAGLCECANWVWVRDSKLGEASPILKVQVPAWEALCAALAAETSSYIGAISLVRADIDWWEMFAPAEPKASLTFDDAEIAAFVMGVRDGEFRPEVLARPDPGGDRTGVDPPGRGQEWHESDVTPSEVSV